MFIAPAQSMTPSIGSPMSCTIFERPPSAPIRYLARIEYTSPPTRSCTVTVTPSASCTCERYSVSKRTRLPRRAASPRMIGSKMSCGRAERGVGQPPRVRAPGVQPRQLVAGQARAEDRVAHQGLRDALGLDLVLEA